MGTFAPKGHARLDPRSPRAFGICERCGFLYNHSDLRWEVQFMGQYIQKTGHLVCPTCWDTPNPQLKPKVLPPDPVPILNPRKEAADSLMDQTEYTVATLPAAASNDQLMTFVTDSTVPYEVTNLQEVVVGGGSYTVPVQSDGTNWIIA